MSLDQGCRSRGCVLPRLLSRCLPLSCSLILDCRSCRSCASRRQLLIPSHDLCLCILPMFFPSLTPDCLQLPSVRSQIRLHTSSFNVILYRFYSQRSGCEGTERGALLSLWRREATRKQEAKGKEGRTEPEERTLGGHVAQHACMADWQELWLSSDLLPSSQAARTQHSSLRLLHPQPRLFNML